MLTSLHLHMKNSEVCVQSRSLPASLPIQGQVTKEATVKWAIAGIDSNGEYLCGTVVLLLAF